LTCSDKLENGIAISKKRIPWSRITWLSTDVGTVEVRIRRIFNLMDGNENLKLMKILQYKAGKQGKLDVALFSKNSGASSVSTILLAYPLRRQRVELLMEYFINYKNRYL
jgi:hypothetical protein